MQLTAAVQECLLAILFYDKASAATVAGLVPSNLYDPFFAELAKAGAAYLTEYGQPAGEHALDLLQTLCERQPKSAEFYRRIHGSILSTKDSINSTYVLKQAGAFIRYQTLKRGLADAITALERENEEGLKEAERTLNASLKQTYDLFDPGVFLSDPNRAMRFFDTELADAFPTGVRELDAHNLGPARKRLHLFTAPAKAGKSWWLVNLAKQSLLNQKRVLYVTLELGEEEVCQRIFQALFSVSKRRESIKVQRFERDELGRFVALDERELNKRPALADPGIREFLTNRQRPLKQKPPLLIRQFPTLSIDGLAGYLDMLESQHKFIPDLLLLDYVTLLDTDSKNYRISIGDNGRKLRALCVERNIAGATASQANREGSRSRWITKEHTAEDITLSATADVQLTYNQTQAEHERGLARLFVAAGRTDRDRFAVLISQAYALGQFVMDSAAMTSDWWDYLDREDDGHNKRAQGSTG